MLHNWCTVSNISSNLKSRRGTVLGVLQWLIVLVDIVFLINNRCQSTFMLREASLLSHHIISRTTASFALLRSSA
jgi:hypothetical protein